MNTVAQRHSMLELSEYIRLRMGLSFPEKRWGELEKKVAMASESLGFPDAEACIEWVLSSPSDRRALEILASFLTVGETYFYREGKSLKALTDRVFPELVRVHAKRDHAMRDHAMRTNERGDNTIRIWSAGCCTGEEPYTIAMMVSACPAFAGWDVKIMATDINREFLEKAKVGVYSDWSFRGVDRSIKDKYFTKVGKAKYEILPAIKRMVDFSYLNLVEDPYPALLEPGDAADLVICRNVLMYFTPEYAQNVIRKFSQALRPDGWLLVSPVEVPLVDAALFSRVSQAGAVLNRKTCEKKQVPIQAVKQPSPPPPRLTASLVKSIEPVVTLRRAQDLYGKADYQGAISMLGILAQRTDAGISEFLLLSRSYANRGMLSEAENWSLRAIGSDRASPESQYLLALIRIEQHQVDEAIKGLRKAICLKPDFAAAHFILANLYRNKKNYEKSGHYLRNAMLALRALGPDGALPESEGMKAADIVELIATSRADGRTDARCRAARCS